MALNVILTAGGRLPKPMLALAPGGVKALLPFAGTHLLGLAVQAARDCGYAARIAAVGGPEVAAAVAALDTGGGQALVLSVPLGQSVIENIMLGFAKLGGAAHEYLIISPDLPFVSGAALKQFLDAARPSAELAFPLVRQADFLTRFPGAPNRFELLDGGRVTLGSCIFTTGRMLEQNIPLALDFYRFRKLPHKLAALLGFNIAWSFLTRRLKLEPVEQRISKLADGRVRGMYVSEAGIAYDVDTQQNYDFALSLTGEQG